jgi:phosphate/sulfate permease
VQHSGSINPEKPRAKAGFFRAVKHKIVHSFQKVRTCYNRLNTTDKILLTALLALLAAAALYGVIAWSCSLSCSGHEAAAWVVAIAGTGVVIFLVLWAGRAINRAYRRRQDRRAHTSAG